MSRSFLRLCSGSVPSSTSVATGLAADETGSRGVPFRTERRGIRIRVRLAEAVPLIRRAMDEQLAWIDDFDDETIDISPDLFELLAVYRRFECETPDAV
ncbi:MAG: hypothetical protein Q4C47_07880 [Planctomycetia bacterium]|nr:hypothetical protein [Planctomycetia bacterium]